MLVQKTPPSAWAVIDHGNHAAMRRCVISQVSEHAARCRAGVLLEELKRVLDYPFEVEEQ